MIRPEIARNPLRTKADLQKAVLDIWEPMKTSYSEGRARVDCGHEVAGYGKNGSEMEAFSRPLWGLVPLLAGGGACPGWEEYILRGLEHGTDPQHPEYWGDIRDYDQRMVEMAAIGLGLRLAPEHTWERLERKAQGNLARWLGQINHFKPAGNNWQFFRVLVNCGLRHVGADTFDAEAMERSLGLCDSYALPDGWYRDGKGVGRGRRDYYVAWALHFYGLLYACWERDNDPARAERLRAHAAAFTPHFTAWFDREGTALPYGRSLTYRFAQGSFWAALVWAEIGEEACGLSTGQVKGMLLRHLRQWLRRPIFGADGWLARGYAYPQHAMCEGYNAKGSPLWALKSFLILALPDDHAFWQAEEKPAPDLPALTSQPVASKLFCRYGDGSHLVALSAGQVSRWDGNAPGKYAKFAYSTRFGLSVSTAQYGLPMQGLDQSFGLSVDGLNWHVRSEPEAIHVEEAGIYSHWPAGTSRVESWSFPFAGGHVRIHRLHAHEALLLIEGGFALPRTEPAPPLAQMEGLRAEAVETGGIHLCAEGLFSGLRNLFGWDKPDFFHEFPQSNLLFPLSTLPCLRGETGPGEVWLGAFFYGQPEELAAGGLPEVRAEREGMSLRLSGLRGEEALHDLAAMAAKAVRPLESDYKDEEA